jgi:hypothetical protein
MYIKYIKITKAVCATVIGTIIMKTIDEKIGLNLNPNRKHKNQEKTTKLS